MSDSEKPKSWQERRQSIKRKWLIPLVYVEWRCEQLSKLLEQWAFLDILGHAGRLTILVAVIFYLKGCPERKMQSANLQMQVKHLESQLENQQKSQHYQAWQVINSAQGKTGSGGRLNALEELNKDGISLAGVDISKAYLPNLILKQANLCKANLSESVLYGANFYKAILSMANLSKSDLRDSNLTKSNLDHSNLAEASLHNVNFSEIHGYKANFVGADLENTNLTNADLYAADLSEAKLNYANLTGAQLSFVILTEADLRYTNLMSAVFYQIQDIELANIHDVKNPPDGFIEWATKQGAVSIEDDEEWKKLKRDKGQE